MSNITLAPIDIDDPFSVYDRMRSFFIETTHPISIGALYALRNKENAEIKHLMETLVKLKEMGRISFTKNNLFALENFNKPGKFRFVSFQSYLNCQQNRLKRTRISLIKQLTHDQRVVYDIIINYILGHGYYPTGEETIQLTKLPRNNTLYQINDLVQFSLVDPLYYDKEKKCRVTIPTKYIQLPPNQ